MICLITGLFSKKKMEENGQFVNRKKNSTWKNKGPSAILSTGDNRFNILCSNLALQFDYLAHYIIILLL